VKLLRRLCGATLATATVVVLMILEANRVINRKETK